MGIESDLEEKIQTLSPSSEPQETIGDLIHAINEYISQIEDGEITWLTPENVQGLEEALVYQQHLENIFGWNVNAINKLIESKLIYTKSIDGRMISKKIEALSVIQTQLSAHIETPPGTLDKLMGNTEK